MDRPVRKGEQMILYVYKVVREDINGNRGKGQRGSQGMRVSSP